MGDVKMCSKVVTAIGLVLSGVGTILVGFVATRGVSKTGDVICAPKKGMSYFGWGMITAGFVLQLIGLFI